MPKLKRKIKLLNIEAFNNDNDVENLGVEELSNNVVEGDSIDDEVNHEKENYSSLAINKIELKLSAENCLQDIDLRNKGYAKIEASEIVSDLMKKGKWFSRCIRSWSKTFLEYGDVPKYRRGQHLIGSSILD
ncbi:20767_t:CDS:2, partial [Entrophospora sp. SA101]